MAMNNGSSEQSQQANENTATGTIPALGIVVSLGSRALVAHHALLLC